MMEENDIDMKLIGGSKNTPTELYFPVFLFLFFFIQHNPKLHKTQTHTHTHTPFLSPVWFSTSSLAAAVCLRVGIQVENDWWKAQPTESCERRAWINIHWAQHKDREREKRRWDRL